MFSPKILTSLLTIAILVISYQNYSLFNLSGKLAEAQVGLGASAAAVNFSDGGGAPDMVGGC